MKIRFIYLALLLISTHLTALAKDSGTIAGRVLDSRSKEPLIGANVIVLDTQFGAASDLNGNFKIDRVPVGTYRLRINLIGYKPALRTDVVVIAARPVFVNVELEPTFLEGEQVNVSAGYFVEEEKIQASTIGLSREEIRRFPGGFEDVVRTVSTLPGVAINSGGGRNDLLVRGGGPSENLYSIENIEVPNINHFGTQGTSSGSLSFVNLDFVQDIAFSTGGFGAQYGDKMSSVLSLDIIDEPPNNFESKWTVSATQYGFNFRTPLTKKGSVIFSARKSYLDLIFKAAGLPFVPVYTDFNILGHFEISPRDHIFILGLSAIDEIDRDISSLKNRVQNAALLDNTQYQGISGVNYRHLLGSGYLDLTMSSNLNRFRLRQLDADEQVYFKSNADEQEFNLKLQHYWIASKKLGLRSGVTSKNVRNENTTTFADTIYDRSGNRIPLSRLGLNRLNETNTTAQKLAAFAEADLFLSPQVTLNLGIRADYYDFIKKSLYLAPRLSLKYQFLPEHTLRAGGGVYYQSPSYVWVLNPVNKNLTALKNQMGILAWDFIPRNDFRISVEGFYKKYSSLPAGIAPGVTDYIVLTNTGTGFGGREDDFQSFGYFDMKSAGAGRAYGMELLLQKKFSEIPCYGLASFSYSKSTVTAANGKTYPGQYDQRFIFNLSGGYIFNSRWEISSKFRYFTGVPYTPLYRPAENPLNPGQIQNLPQEYLAARLKAGHHLDVRVDRYFSFSNITLITYLDIQNIYNYKIPQRPSFDFWEDKIITESGIGILPSIGISLEF
jgi:hypothetical protein